ncbi:MAG TPA: FKBP-type peptidyl-prolyl cis-trans isomerase [Vicinamibacterales bacterium]
MTRVTILLLCALLAACSSRDERAAPRDVAAPPADALKTPSGLASKVLRVGLGSTHPRPESMVTVHYTGWTADGKMFETTMTDKQPVTLRVTDAIPGWIEGLQLMRAGEKRRFWIPGSLAYDNNPNPELPKGMLVFDIELIRIQ